MNQKEFTTSNIAGHILQTSSNLLGLCFLILSLIKINKIGGTTLLDESLITPILLFFTSSILSYLSLRPGKKSQKLEAWADKIFIIGLFSITLISVIFILKIIA
jgi:hypothetical protein